MRAKDSLAKNETSLRLAALSKAVERIFSVTGFNEYFEVFETREDAICAN
jgi:anti-sigma B factor antagonist